MNMQQIKILYYFHFMDIINIVPGTMCTYYIYIYISKIYTMHVIKHTATCFITYEKYVKCILYIVIYIYWNGVLMEVELLSHRAMAPRSSTLAWKILWTEEPGGLQSMGSLRVRHDWATSLSLFTFMHWRRKGQPTPVFLPGESQGRGSLVGCRLWGHTESDTTEAT